MLRALSLALTLALSTVASAEKVVPAPERAEQIKQLKARVAAIATTVFQARIYRDSEGNTLPYRLFVPREYDASQSYPLILFLHGAGERGADNLGNITRASTLPAGIWVLPEYQEKHPCFVLAPQCPKGQKWVNVQWWSFSHKQEPQPTQPLRLALEILHAVLEEFNIDRQRLYVLGLSMGGYGTWDLITRYPTLFAAAAPICGGMPDDTAHLVTNIPIWVFHGDKDKVVPVDRSRNAIRELEKLGAKARYSEYQGVGHFCWDLAVTEEGFAQWLFAQRRPQK